VEIGDLVKLKKLYSVDGYYPNEHLVGIVIDKGTEQRRMYGDGIQLQEYVDVKWFGPEGKYRNIARYSPGPQLLEVVSEA
tara:strand:- start:157 stop:396 length:240 start_codon:yes stop_codon:yes gene_type:complete